jgi:hypothetical protein
LYGGVFFYCGLELRVVCSPSVVLRSLFSNPLSATVVAWVAKRLASVRFNLALQAQRIWPRRDDSSTRSRIRLRFLGGASAAEAQGKRALDDVAGVRRASTSPPGATRDTLRTVNANVARALAPDSSRRRTMWISVATGVVAGAALGGISGRTLAYGLCEAPRDQCDGTRPIILAGVGTGAVAGGLVGYLAGLLIVDRPR